MSLPYESTTAGDRAIAQLQRTLEKFGCASFGTMTDAERGVLIVQFRHRDRMVSIEASWKGYAKAILNSHGWNTRSQEERALAQARLSVCSVLRDWIKGQITAIECGVLSFEAAFMPHILLANGKRIIDKIQADNLLPAPKP